MNNFMMWFCHPGKWKLLSIGKILVQNQSRTKRDAGQELSESGVAQYVNCRIRSFPSLLKDIPAHFQQYTISLPATGKHALVEVPWPEYKNWYTYIPT